MPRGRGGATLPPRGKGKGRGRGKGKPRRRQPNEKRAECPHGAECKYMHEYQHQLEYYHPHDAPQQPQPGPFASHGQLLGGAIHKTPRGAATSSASRGRGTSRGRGFARGAARGASSSDSQVGGVIDLDDDDAPIDLLPCEICGSRISATILAVHMLHHERTGEADVYRAALERQRQRDESEAEFQAALREDQQREAAAEASAAAAREQERASAEATAARDEALAKAAARREALPAEPPAGGADVATLRVRLADGCVVTRRFTADACMAQVFDWLSTFDTVAVAPSWTLHAPAAFAIEGPLYASEETVRELGLVPSAALNLHAEADS